MDLRWARRHASALVLTALAIVAAAIVFFLDKGSVSTNEAEMRKRNLIAAWRSDDVTRVDVVAKGRTARLVKTAVDGGDPTWDVEIDGRRWPADQQVVDQYLGTLEFATHERRVEPGAVDRAAAGLDAPRVSVALEMGKLHHRLAIGGEATSPVGGRYAEVEGRGVFVITSQLAAALDVAPDSFRSRTLVPYFSTDLAGLSLDGDGGARRFVRAAWGGGRGAGWSMASGTPPSVRASAAAMDKLLMTLGQLQVEEFIPMEAAERALDRRVTLTMAPKDAKAQRGLVELGGACPVGTPHTPGPDRPDRIVAVRREPTPLAACVAKAILDALTVPAQDFVDRRLIGASVDEVNEVKLESAGKMLEMARAGSAWHLRAPADRDVPADVGRSFVEGLTSIEVARFVGGDPASLGLAPPRGTVRVVSPGGPGAADAGGDRIEVLEVGEERPGAPGEGAVVNVRRLEDGAIAEVPAAQAGSLLPRDLALRPRKVFDVASRRFRAIRIEAAERVQRVERQGEEAWKLLEPTGPGLAADVGFVMDVAELMGSLSAERWVSDKDDGSFGLDRPRIVIEARVAADEAGAPDAGATRTLRVVLGAATSGGSFARADGEPAVFVASKNLEAAATRLLLDRQALAFPLAGVRRVTLRAGDKKLVVEHEGDTWRVPGDSGAVARAATVRDALDDLIAEGAASLGAPRPHEALDRPRLEIVAETGGPPVRIAVGAGDSYRGTSVYYARRAGVDATYAVAQAKLRPLFEVLAGPSR